MKKYLMREIMNGEKLTVMQDRINKAAAIGMITMDDKAELDKALHAAANPNENQPDLRQMLLALEERVKALEEKNGITNQPETPDDGEYPAWKPWDGISQDYQLGAKVEHNGKVWESIFNGQNTWEPGTIGTEALWKVYITF